MNQIERGDAYISPCGEYRYWLTRIWDRTLPLLCIFGVNPSKADAKIDDPTIRKDIGFAKRLGFGGILKLNAGAFRATDPNEWRKALDPIGPENTVEHLKQYIANFKPTKIVVAWGKSGNYAHTACMEIVKAIPDLYCFGKNPDGTPRHTLMLSYATELEPYTLSEVTNAPPVDQ